MNNGVTSKLVLMVRGLLASGFFHIAGAGIANKVISVLLSIILVRILSKPEYGIYAYAQNIISILVLFNGFGVTSAILQICSERYKEGGRSHSIFNYGYKAGVITDLIMVVAVVLVAIMVPLAIQGSNELLLAYSPYPILSLLYEIKLMQLRVRLQNKEYAFATNLSTVLLAVFSVIGALLAQALGLVVGQQLAYVVTYLFMCIKYPFRNRDDSRLSKCEKKDFWRISIVSAFNNGLGQALTLLGTFLVGCLLASDELVAGYQVATLVPFGLLFVPSIVVTYIYPYFARNKDDAAWTICNFRKVLLGNMALTAVIVILVCSLATPIVCILFGEQYLDIVPVLQCLMIGFFFTAGFRQIAGNLLVTQRKLLFNTAIGIASLVVCAAMSVCLIPSLGMMGAALSYDFVMFFGAVANIARYTGAIRRIGGTS